MDGFAPLDDFVPPLLDLLEEKMTNAELDSSPDCYALASCEANNPSNEFSFNTVGDALREIFG